MANGTVTYTTLSLDKLLAHGLGCAQPSYAIHSKRKFTVYGIGHLFA